MNIRNVIRNVIREAVRSVIRNSALCKLSCDSRFQSVFSACICVFKVITLVGQTGVFTLKTQIHAVNAR
jgi:hypothetical protein